MGIQSTDLGGFKHVQQQLKINTYATDDTLHGFEVY